MSSPAAFKRLDKSEATLISTLYYLNVLSSSRISRNLSMSQERVAYFFEYTLDRLGFTLKPDIMYGKLGLIGVTAIYRRMKIRDCNLDEAVFRIPYIRALSILPPSILIASFLIPRDLANYVKSGPSPTADVYTYEYTIRSKPKIDLLDELLSGHVETLVEPKVVEELVSAKRLIREEDVVGRARFDKIDLAVLHELSVNPGLSIRGVKKAVEERLRRKFIRFESHVEHAEKFIYGYRLAILRSKYVQQIVKCLYLKASESLNLCNSVIRHPLVVNCSGSSSSGESIICIMMPTKVDALTTLETFINALTSLGCEVIDSFEYAFGLLPTRSHFAAATVPLTEWARGYSDWLKEVDPVSYAFNVLKSLNCIESP
ncbi:MAG: hypothetical protein N3E36_04675 [Sulfolobales archaeon]|nr:hypothetical protein [Sulfolobales archaeon]